MEYFAKKDSSGQSIAGLIFILRGNTGNSSLQAHCQSPLCLWLQAWTTEIGLLLLEYLWSDMEVNFEAVAYLVILLAFQQCNWQFHPFLRFFAGRTTWYSQWHGTSLYFIELWAIICLMCVQMGKTGPTEHVLSHRNKAWWSCTQGLIRGYSYCVSSIYTVLAGLIIWNAGIGKSIFLYFFMQELAASGQTVVLQRRKHRTVAFTKQGAFQGPEDGSLIGFGDFLKDPNNW